MRITVVIPEKPSLELNLRLQDTYGNLWIVSNVLQALFQRPGTRRSLKVFERLWDKYRKHHQTESLECSASQQEGDFPVKRIVKLNNC